MSKSISDERPKRLTHEAEHRIACIKDNYSFGYWERSFKQEREAYRDMIERIEAITLDDSNYEVLR